MESISTEAKRQTILRLNPITINRLKTKAKAEHTSYNSLVERILVDYTKDIRSEAEIQEERKKTQDFLDCCVGIWEGKEYDDVEKFIKEGRTSKPIVEL